MARRLLTALSVLAVTMVLTYAMGLRPSASVLPEELNVISRTRGNELLTAEVLDNQVRVRLKNNHKDTITAFAIRFTDTVIKEDFAYSEVHFGIEPGDTFQKEYAFSGLPMGSEPLYLLTVLLKDGTKDGDSKVAQEIKDERLGEKIQIFRTLRILEKEGQSRKDLQITKSEIVAALDSGESETLITLNELEPTSRTEHRFSDDLKTGLEVGRQKMLQRFEILKELPTEYREKGFIEYKERSSKLFAKL